MSAVSGDVVVERGLDEGAWGQDEVSTGIHGLSLARLQLLGARVAQLPLERTVERGWGERRMEGWAAKDDLFLPCTRRQMEEIDLFVSMCD